MTRCDVKSYLFTKHGMKREALQPCGFFDATEKKQELFGCLQKIPRNWERFGVTHLVCYKAHLKLVKQLVRWIMVQHQYRILEMF